MKEKSERGGDDSGFWKRGGANNSKEREVSAKIIKILAKVNFDRYSGYQGAFC